MPIPGARYRWKTMPSGKKVRLAFKNNRVVEAQNESGETHTPAEFARDRAKAKARNRTKGRFSKRLTAEEIDGGNYRL